VQRAGRYRELSVPASLCHFAAGLSNYGKFGKYGLQTAVDFHIVEKARGLAHAIAVNHRK
jgi:hypothetical protein